MLQFDDTFYDKMMKLSPPEEIKHYIRETLCDSNIFRVNEWKEDVKNEKYPGHNLDIVDGGELISYYLNKIVVRQFMMKCDVYVRDNYKKFPDFIHGMKEILRDELDIGEKEFINNEPNRNAYFMCRDNDDALLLSIWLFHKFEYILDTHDEEYISKC